MIQWMNEYMENWMNRMMFVEWMNESNPQPKSGMFELFQHNEAWTK